VSPPIVLCVEFESYICAVAAMDHLAASLAPSEVATKQAAALADFKRAHAMYLAVDACITTPALLKRQAG
jgi:hypothetical protein